MHIIISVLVGLVAAVLIGCRQQATQSSDRRHQTIRSLTRSVGL